MKRFGFQIDETAEGVFMIELISQQNGEENGNAKYALFEDQSVSNTNKGKKYIEIDCCSITKPLDGEEVEKMKISLSHCKTG